MNHWSPCVRHLAGLPAGTFYTTVFNYASELFLLGVDAGSGAIVYASPVRNPFIDLAAVPSAARLR